MREFDLGRVARAHALATALCVAAACAAWAEVQTGIEAYRNGNFQSALQEFEGDAMAGDKRAQYNLGVMMLKGTGIQQDVEGALKWHRLSADQGYAPAQHGLGVMFFRGDGVTTDPSEAAKWFRKAAEQDFAQSQLNLGVMYLTGRGVRKDGAEVVKWITLAAAKGLPEAQYRLAVMYDKGMIFQANRIEASRWYEKASKQGHRKSGKRLATLDSTPPAEKSPAPEAKPAEPAPPVAAIKPTAPPKTTKPTRAWHVQLASFRSAAEVDVAWRRLTIGLPELLDGLTQVTVEADLGPERGIYHRLTAGPLENRNAARALCRNIKERAPRQGCLPISH